MSISEARDVTDDRSLHGDCFPRIEALHATAHRMVFAFAGAGSEALHLLHAVAGSSRTVLGACDLYHPTALRDALVEGLTVTAPTRRDRAEGRVVANGGAVRTEVADRLASAAHARALEIVRDDDPPGPVFGVGLTATLITDRPKRGDHRFHLSVADALGVRRVAVTLAKGARTRKEEEAQVTGWTLAATGEAAGLLGWATPPTVPGDLVVTSATPSEAYRQFLDTPSSVAVLDRDGRLTVVDARARSRSGARLPSALVSGSFHPMHEGHRRLARAAEAFLGVPVGYEMSLDNAEKASLDAEGAWQRSAQAHGDRAIVLTHDPLFVDKSERLPGTTWVVGVDTARRILERRFYESDAEMAASMARIRERGSRFLVAGRDVGGEYSVLSDLSIPAHCVDLFIELPHFRDDSSSTKVRATWPRRGDQNV